jgi:HAD superfamily hydrolase (TIGR01457 family)
VIPERLAAARGFIVDLDGTTYLGDRPIEGARECLEFLAASGRRHLFVTNNSSTTGAAYVAKLRRLGLPVQDGQVLTSGEATAMLLARRACRRLYVLGTPDLEGELAGAGFDLVSEDPECVVLGFDKTVTYAKLEAASRFIAAGVPFVATHPDVVCPTPTGYVPDCGSLIACLRAATGVEPLVVGKPEPLLVEMALAKLGLEAHETVVVGDRLYTDLAMARRSGALGVLVLSGETSRDMLAGSSERPDFVCDSLGALAEALRAGEVVGTARTALGRHE